jgi:hypothetical protein
MGWLKGKETNQGAEATPDATVNAIIATTVKLADKETMFKSARSAVRSVAAKEPLSTIQDIEGKSCITNQTAESYVKAWDERETQISRLREEMQTLREQVDRFTKDAVICMEP